MGNEGCLPLVSILDANIVIPPLNIKFGNDLGIFDLVDEVLDKGERVGVFDGVTVDILVVLAGLEGVRSVFLVDKEK